MRFESSLIEQVASLNDIVDIISSYVTIKKAGRSFKGLCPFHSEKSPSFHVNPERQIFHCFGCGAGGDVIAFIQKIENLSFPEALEFLAKGVRFELPRKNFESSARHEESKTLYTLYEKALEYYRALYQGPAGETARAYMTKRHFKEDVLNEFEVGFSLDGWRGLTDTLSREGFREELLLKSGLVNRSPKGSLYDLFRGRVLFPIRSAQGRVVAFGGRVITAEAKPKYLNSPETDYFKKGRELFALSIAKKHLTAENPRILIVEGYLDCLRLHEAGFKNTVATLGTALTEDHVKLLRRYVEEAVLIFDGDKAGVSASLRSLDIFLEEGFPVKVVSLEGGLDPDDYLLEKGKDAFAKKLETAQDFFEFKLRNFMGRFSKNDPAGLLKITSNLLEMIAKMPSDILQDHYLKKLSSELRVDENSLRSELAKLRSRLKNLPGGSRASQPEKKEPAGLLRKEEIHLLYLMSEEEGAGHLAEVSERDLSDPLTLRAFQVLGETRKDHPGGSCFSAFVMRLEESNLKRKIIELSFLEWGKEERAKALQDCLRMIVRLRREGERKALEAKIRSAEENGELSRLAEYLKDFQNLNSMSVKGK